MKALPPPSSPECPHSRRRDESQVVKPPEFRIAEGMLRPATPLTAIKIEHVRNGDGLDVRTQLAVALQDQIVVAERVVLHVTIGMRWQW